MLDRLNQKIEERGLRTNVSIIDSAHTAERDRALASAEYFLQAGRAEGFGIAIIDAAFAGCIPVVSCEGGAGEIVSRELQYSSIQEEVGIFDKLSSGWRPSSIFAEDVDYGERALQPR